MTNPWKEIALSDYENHMSFESVRQLQALSDIMKDQLASTSGKTVMVLGIAGGTGLCYTDASKLEVLYGVDVNPDYLEECKRRYPGLKDIFKPICADLSADGLSLPNADLLIADLLIEYIGYRCFQRVVDMVKPKRVSCVIQVNEETAFVSTSPYLHAFDKLSEVHCDIEEDGLETAMKEIGYLKVLSAERPLPNGKKLLRLDFSPEK